MINNIIDRFKPKSKEQYPVNLISLLLHEFNQSHHHEPVTDKVHCEMAQIQQYTRRTIKFYLQV